MEKLRWLCIFRNLQILWGMAVVVEIRRRVNILPEIAVRKKQETQKSGYREARNIRGNTALG